MLIGWFFLMGREKDAELGIGTQGSDRISLHNFTTEFKNNLSNLTKDKSQQMNIQKQNKHVRGTKEFVESKSEITIDLVSLASLVNKYRGSGTKYGNSKEVINFKIVIGIYRNSSKNKSYKTTFGTVHYSKTGYHVVPAFPKIMRRNKK